jgi:hypothetical protein
LENKRAEQVLPRRRVGGAQTMYTHVSKCKNNKMKEEKVVGRAKKKKNDSKGQ